MEFCINRTSRNTLHRLFRIFSVQNTYFFLFHSESELLKLLVQGPIMHIYNTEVHQPFINKTKKK